MLRPSTNPNDTRAVLPVFRVSRFTVHDFAASDETGIDGPGGVGGGAPHGDYILTSTGLMYTGGKRDRDGGHQGMLANTTLSPAEAEYHKQQIKQLHVQKQNAIANNRLMKIRRRLESTGQPVASVEAVIVMHDHDHPHVLMLRYHTTVMVPRPGANNVAMRGGNNLRMGQAMTSIPTVTYNYRLPGGTCREKESEVECLLRKLGRRLLGHAKEPKTSHLPTGSSDFDDGNGGGGGGGLQAGKRVPIHDGGITVVTQQHGGDASRQFHATPKKIQSSNAAGGGLATTPPLRPSGVANSTPNQHTQDENPAVAAERPSEDELMFSLSDAPTSNSASSPPKGTSFGTTPMRASATIAGSPLNPQVFTTSSTPVVGTTTTTPAASSFLAPSAVPHVTVYSSAAKSAAEVFHVSQVLSTWYRPSYDKPLFPYRPAHVTREKESRRIYLVTVDDVDELRFTINADHVSREAEPSSLDVTMAAGRNNINQQQQPRIIGRPQTTAQGVVYDLVAVPLFDLYNNAAKYGTIAESIPHILSRFNMQYNDE